MTDRFKREIKFTPAFDRRHEDPKKDYGIHGLTMTFYLHGPKGVIQFVIYTNWHLKHVWDEQDKRSIDPVYPHLLCRPMAADIGYHSPTPQYEPQTIRLDCKLIPGGCYYDGSSLHAEPILTKLISKGEEALWSELETYYDIWLEHQKGDQ